MKIYDRIIEVINANGGEFPGTERLSFALPAPLSCTHRAINKLKKHNRIRIKPGGGRGRLTVYRLTSKGRKYVQSK